MPRIGGIFVAKNPAFEALHPRDRKGRDRGQFVDVPGKMAEMGAEWNAPRGVWLVPQERRAEFDGWLADIGYDSVSVPEGMRIANEDDRGQRYGPGQKIPPGWTDVMVAESKADPVQVRGRDSAGRLQAIRSREATAAASAEKFERVKQMDAKMPAVDERLEREALGDDTAAAMLLLRKMALRPGSTKDTKAKVQAYGASTLERRHVSVQGDKVRLRFVGKEGVNNDLTVRDAQLAKVLQHRLKGKGGDDQMFPGANANKMNRWIQGTAPGHTAKDFRTHFATGMAAELMAGMDPPRNDSERRSIELAVGAKVAEALGNKRKQALESYIDPAVFGWDQKSSPRMQPDAFAMGDRVVYQARYGVLGRGVVVGPPKGGRVKVRDDTGQMSLVDESGLSLDQPDVPPLGRAGTIERRRLKDADRAGLSLIDVKEQGAETYASLGSPGMRQKIERLEEIDRDIADFNERTPYLSVPEVRRMRTEEILEYDSGRRPIVPLQWERARLKKQLDADRRKAVGKELARRREVGGFDPGQSDGRRKLADQANQLPAEWLPAVSSVRVKESRDRANWDGKTIEAWTSQDMMHELGHAIEERNPEIGRLAREMLAERAEGRSLKDLGGRMSGEMVYDGAFQYAYTGKKYRSGDTELISMGLEGLFSNKKRGGFDFWDGDPEYRNFMLGVLFGAKKGQGDRDKELAVSRPPTPNPNVTEIPPGDVEPLPAGRVRVRINGQEFDGEVIRVSSDGKKAKVRIGKREPWVPMSDVLTEADLEERDNPPDPPDPDAPPGPPEPPEPEVVPSLENPDAGLPLITGGSRVGEPSTPGSKGRGALANAWAGGYTEGEELAGGKMNMSIKKVKLSDGSTAVLKTPASADEHRKELASGVVANALGFPVHTIDVGDGRLLTSFADGEPGAFWALGQTGPPAFDENLSPEFLRAREALVSAGMPFGNANAAASILNAPGAREMGVLDWLTRNRDRHAQNWIVGADGSVSPIDHGLTYFSTTGADRDVPNSPFSRYWLGLSQEPTPRPARGKAPEEALQVKGAKARIAPRLSQAWLEQLKDRLQADRGNFTDAEWAGVMARLDLLVANAPSEMADELPFGELQ